MGMGAAGLALGAAALLAELPMPKRVTALAMRRAAGLVLLRGLAPVMAVLRVRVRRVVGADGRVAGAGVTGAVIATDGVSITGVVLTAGTSRAGTGAAVALALEEAFGLVVRAALARDEGALALEDLAFTASEVSDLAGAALRDVLGLAAALVVAVLVVAVLVVAVLVVAVLVRLTLARALGLSASPRLVRVRCANTSAHSASLRLAGLAPWVWATLAAFSMSAIRFCQEVAKRLSDWDLAPLSTRVSITPSALTFLRRRWKISFCNWAMRASPFSLIWMVS